MSLSTAEVETRQEWDSTLSSLVFTSIFHQPQSTQIERCAMITYDWFIRLHQCLTGIGMDDDSSLSQHEWKSHERVKHGSFCCYSASRCFLWSKFTSSGCAHSTFQWLEEINETSHIHLDRLCRTRFGRWSGGKCEESCTWQSLSLLEWIDLPSPTRDLCSHQCCFIQPCSRRCAAVKGLAYIHRLPVRSQSGLRRWHEMASWSSWCECHVWCVYFTDRLIRIESNGSSDSFVIQGDLLEFR